MNVSCNGLLAVPHQPRRQPLQCCLLQALLDIVESLTDLLYSSFGLFNFLEDFLLVLRQVPACTCRWWSWASCRGWCWASCWTSCWRRGRRRGLRIRRSRRASRCTTPPLTDWILLIALRF